MADKENIFDSKVVTEEFSFKNSLLFYTILWLVRLFEEEFITLFDDFFFKYFEDAPRL